VSERVDRDANRELRARFDDVYGQYQQLRSGLDELGSRLAELRVTRRSADGRVSATVGAAMPVARASRSSGWARSIR
jgi:hypothetical protein